MKVYIVYVMCDYATALFMTADRAEADNKSREYEDTLGRDSWVTEYEFTETVKSFELECD